MFSNPLQEKTWKILERRWGELGFEGLTTEEREVISLFWLEGETMNGGLDQFFHNSSGDLAPHAISGLKRIGAHKSLALLESAIGKFCTGAYPVDRDTRWAMLQALPEGIFDAETDALTDLPERFFENAVDALASQYRATGVAS